MRTYLNYDTKKLIKKLNSPKEFYEITSKESKLQVNKIYVGKRGRPFSVTLPREIKIFPEAIGLIVGEGFISDGQFVFANSNEKAVTKILGFLKQFNLPIKFYLELSIKKQPKNFINKSKKFWEKYLEINLDKIRLREEFYNITRNGTIHVILNNSLVAKLLKQIVRNSKKKIEKSKILSIGYLKGILAAEGNINVKKKTNCVYMVRISASKKEERDHYKRCLEKVGINVSCKDMPTVSKQEAKERGWKTTKGRAGAVIISKWGNFLKIFLLDLLSLNKEKQVKFNQYFINNKFTKQFLSLSSFIDKEFTMKQAQEYFNFSGRHIDRVLSLLKQGYISRRKINNIKFSYKLNNKYILTYDKLKPILNNPSD